jgi:hypothetical protein
MHDYRRRSQENSSAKSTPRFFNAKTGPSRPLKSVPSLMVCPVDFTAHSGRAPCTYRFTMIAVTVTVPAAGREIVLSPNLVIRNLCYMPTKKKKRRGVFALGFAPVWFPALKMARKASDQKMVGAGSEDHTTQPGSEDRITHTQPTCV